MKSETRANWIFLALFMLVMTPGLIILSIKAYKKGAAGMNPPAPQTVAAYNNPNPQNPMLPRVVPPETAGFVDSVASRLLKLQPRLYRPERSSTTIPEMSDKLSLEWIASGAGENDFYIALLGWDRTFAPLPSLYQFTAMRAGQKVPAKMSAYEQLNLPIEARAELQQYGYLLPPDSAMWIILAVPGREPVDSIGLRYVIDGRTLEDQMNLSRPATSQPISR